MTTITRTDITRTDSARTHLDAARGRVHEAVVGALDRLDPAMRHACGYHLGLWDERGRPTAGGGKGLRPELVLLSAAAVGGDPVDAVPAAVAVELVHNFSLLHDDVMDRDTERRHRPTVWCAFGVPTAILAGDVLLALAEEVLGEAPSPTVGWAVQALSATTRRLIAGQAADLGFEGRDDVGLEECLRMESDKTGALLACASSIGPMLLDAPSPAVSALARFGEHLGVAFQLVDDLLGIWGEPAVTGKPVLSDLRSRKKSAPVVAALSSGTAPGRRLGRLYRQSSPLTEDELREAARLVEAAGGRAWAQHRAAAELDTALRVLDAALPREASASLRGFACRLAGRDR